jgi:flavin reductase (DIM6/NTAB) family NADH-FMN oxidoreductase RutF
MSHGQPTTETDAQLSQPAGAAAVGAGGDDTLATVLGRIPSGLFVVTWRESGHDRGMLASWVMQAGFQPPTITVAVGTSRGLLAALGDRTPFVVNVLGESQRPLLARFGRPAGPGDDPFAGLAVNRAPCGAASIADAVGWLECHATAQVDAGDHAVVVATVTAAGAGSGAAPLVHLRRNGLRY